MHFLIVYNKLVHCTFCVFIYVFCTCLGPTFRAKACLSGCREGMLVLYHYDSYPYHAIGCISFMWQPISDNFIDTTDNERQLWIWCHPSCYREVWDEIQKCYKEMENSEVVDTSVDIVRSVDSVCLTLPPKPTAEKNNQSMNKMIDHSKIKDESAKDVSAEQIEANEAKVRLSTDNSVKSGHSTDESMTAKSVSDEKTEEMTAYSKPRSLSCTIGSIRVSSLKDNLVRHRLIGPKSHAILSNIVKPAIVDLNYNWNPDMDGEPMDTSTTESTPNDNGTTQHWWQAYYADNDHLKANNDQTMFVETRLYHCQSPGEVPPRSIVGMVVRDPRLLRPQVRTAAQTQDKGKVVHCIDEIFSITVECTASSHVCCPIVVHYWCDGIDKGGCSSEDGKMECCGKTFLYR